MSSRLSISLDYTKSIQKQIQVVVAHTFNPSTREVETGAIRLGGERNVTGKRQELTGVWSLRFGGDTVQSRQSEDHPLRSEHW